jgi:Uma2 family endonuclease
MAGASEDHNRIAGNIFSFLHEKLRGKRCEPFMADMKFKLPDSEVFYYPDVLVACEPSDNAKYYRERPTIVFEVLSAETERTDQREKRFAYVLASSLKVYVIVSQEQARLTVLRRGRSNSWQEQVIEGLDGTLNLPEIKVEIPLTRIYERTPLSTTG